MTFNFLPAFQSHGAIEVASMVGSKQSDLCAHGHEAPSPVQPASNRSDEAGCASGNTITGGPRLAGQNAHVGESGRCQGSNSLCDQQQLSPSPPASPHSGSSGESLTPSLRLALSKIFGSKSSSGSSDDLFQRHGPSDEPHCSTFQSPPRSSFEYEAEGGSSSDVSRIGHEGSLASDNYDIDEVSSWDNEFEHPKTPSMAFDSDSDEHMLSWVPRDDMGELTSHVPLDDKGQLMSIGSASHYEGHCQPCVFIFTSVGCSNGVACLHCHFPHDANMMDSPPRRNGRRTRERL